MQVKRIESLLINCLFCAIFFFWDIQYGYFRVEVLVIIFFLFLFNKKKLFFETIKSVKFSYFFLLHLLLINYILNQPIVFESYIKIIYLFILEMIIIKYHDHLSKNLNSVIFIFFTIFIFYTYFFLFDPLINCLGCFNLYNKFFLENSHLNMISTAVVLYSFFYLIEHKDFKYSFFFLFFLIILFYNFSVTFFFGLVLTLFFLVIFLKKINKFKILYSFLFLILVFIIFNPKFRNEIVKRVIPGNLKEIIFTYIDKDKNIENKIKYNLSKYDFNLSTEVYLKNIITCYEILKNNPFGVGLDNFKSYTLNEIFLFRHNNTKNLNNEDGSQNFSKGLSEFGFFYFYIFFLLFKFVRNSSINLDVKLFFISILILQTFVRGAGYFNGAYLFSIIFLFHHMKSKKTIK